MAESVYVLLVTAALLLAYRAADAPSPLRFAALGVVIGLSALTRAEGLFFAVVLVIPLVIGLRSLATKRRALLAVIAIGTAILVVVPWTIRNAVRLHAFVPISNNIGTAVDGANCDLTYSGSQIGLRSEEHTSELQSRENIVCRLLLEKKKNRLGSCDGDRLQQSKSLLRRTACLT